MSRHPMKRGTHHAIKACCGALIITDTMDLHTHAMTVVVQKGEPI